MDRWIDRSVALSGVFEPATTDLVTTFVSPGMYVLDIGANIGYYTLLLARAVGPQGRVWAFEPTAALQQDLKWHVVANGFADRVVIVPVGLSDHEGRADIAIDNISATLHWAEDGPPNRVETIDLRRLDAVAADLGIEKLDFVKIDIDGHEFHLLKGAEQILREHRPTMVMEMAQSSLHVAATDVRELARLIHAMGYSICDERTRRPFPSEMAFLRECGNFDRSANVLLVPAAAEAAGP